MVRLIVGVVKRDKFICDCFNSKDGAIDSRLLDRGYKFRALVSIPKMVRLIA